MRDFALGACSSGRRMKPTTISTSCRSGWRRWLISSHAHQRSFRARGEVTATSTSCRTGKPLPAVQDLRKGVEVADASIAAVEARLRPPVRHGRYKTTPVFTHEPRRPGTHHARVLYRWYLTAARASRTVGKSVVATLALPTGCDARGRPRCPLYAVGKSCWLVLRPRSPELGFPTVCNGQHGRNS
jgi:hypothetical protein